MYFKNKMYFIFKNCNILKNFVRTVLTNNINMYNGHKTTNAIAMLEESFLNRV